MDSLARQIQTQGRIRPAYTRRPTPVVAVLGLDAQLVGRATRALGSVSDALKVPVSFQAHPAGHSFRARKRGASSHSAGMFDGRTPQGLIKHSWFHKHHDVMPAVILLPYEFSSDASSIEWSRKEAAICEHIRRVRSSISTRSHIRIVLLLVQPRQGGGGGGGDAAATRERSHSLRRRADVDSKWVEVVTEAEVTAGQSSTTMRKLHKLILDTAELHYKVEGKRIKGHKRMVIASSLKKDAQVALHVRHNFKVRAGVRGRWGGRDGVVRDPPF